jgi:hypothetical protein
MPTPLQISKEGKRSKSAVSKRALLFQERRATALAESLKRTSAYMTSKTEARFIILFAFAALQDLADASAVHLYLGSDPDKPSISGSVNFDTMMAACDVLEGKEVKQ